MPIYRLNKQPVFPDPKLAEPGGLLAIGGDLSPARLVEAYRQGIFPWYSDDDPLLWWFTSPRLVIHTKEFKSSKRLLRDFRKPLFNITMDQAFSDVISSCATIRSDKRDETWITKEMQQAYCTLHDLGFAHSVECWENENLVGGLYGIALGKVFFGESMFSYRNNSSKIALVALVNYLKEKQFKLVDCQMTTQHLMQFGAKEITGPEFSDLLAKYILDLTPSGAWKYGDK